MLSDLDGAFTALRERIAVPDFPKDAIVSASRQMPSNGFKRFWAPIAIAVFSAAAIAAAAELVAQTQVHFTRSGGMVVSSSSNVTNRAITSEGPIDEAASRLNFKAILPAGLPEGTKPMRLYMSGNDVMAITYDLPGAWRATHHMAWVFLTNPSSIEGTLSQTAYRLRLDGRMSSAHWRVGDEEVIVVSNGLTTDEVQRIKASMKP